MIEILELSSSPQTVQYLHLSWTDENNICQVCPLSLKHGEVKRKSHINPFVTVSRNKRPIRIYSYSTYCSSGWMYRTLFLIGVVCVCWKIHAEEIRLLCGEPAISLHSHHVSLVRWTTRLLPVMRDPGSISWGILI
jgi:hypothetical protein